MDIERAVTYTSGLMNRLVVILSEAKNPPVFSAGFQRREILRFAQNDSSIHRAVGTIQHYTA